MGIGLLLGFSRAVSDTMIALMVSGNSPQLPQSLFDSFRSLTAHMALVISQDAFGSIFSSLYPAASLLLGFSFLCQIFLLRHASLLFSREYSDGTIIII